MKVRMTIGISGGRGDGTDWPLPGGVLEVSDREGAELCAAGLAEPVADLAEKTEKAVPPAAEERATPGPAARPKAAKHG